MGKRRCLLGAWLDNQACGNKLMHYTAPRTVTALAALRQYARTHSERRALSWAIAQTTNRNE